MPRSIDRMAGINTLPGSEAIARAFDHENDVTQLQHSLHASVAFAG
jgi:hypothetical protein